MTRKEALLLKVMEECDELSQRCSKAIRFTLEEIQEGQELTNAERIVEEARDLSAVLQILGAEGHIPRLGDNNSLGDRMQRIEKYISYSKSLGTVTD